jgi:hypothetical protein
VYGALPPLASPVIVFIVPVLNETVEGPLILAITLAFSNVVETGTLLQLFASVAM